MAKTDLNLIPLHTLQSCGRRLYLFAITALSFLTLAPVYAADKESAGMLLTFSGKVEIIRGEANIPPANRVALFSGDVIVTGDGQVQIRFADGTMLALYRDTRFSVDSYHYGKGKDDRAQFSLLNGVMHTLTGQIDKNNYLLKTRLANLGIRGTEYSVQLGEMLHVSVDQGRVELANTGGTIQIAAGQSAIVTGANVMPRPSTGGKIDLRMHGHGPGGPRGGPSGNGPRAEGAPATQAGGNEGGRTSPPPPPPGTQNISRQSGNSGGSGGNPPPPPPPR